MEASPTPLERLLDRLPSPTPLQRLLDHVSSPAAREAFTLHIRHSALCSPASASLSTSPSSAPSPSSPPPPAPTSQQQAVVVLPRTRLSTLTRRQAGLEDRFGRERIFHGVNVVFKGEPWLPQMQGFDPQLSSPMMTSQSCASSASTSSASASCGRGCIQREAS